MTTVGFITTPLTSGHAVRGVGFYTQRLLTHLKSLAFGLNIEIIELTDKWQMINGKLDIIHYPFFDPFFHTLPLIKKTKTVVTIHDVIPLEFPDHYPPGLRGWTNLQLQKLSLANTDRIITDSFYSLVNINKYLGVPPHKLRLIYLAADPVFKKITHPVNKYNLPQKFALYVGDINYNKNIPNLVAACKRNNLPLVIVGKQAQEIESKDLTHPELAHLHSLDLNSIIRLGFVDNLVNIYNLATVYVQPSLSEGFGLPVLEAQACGTPVACSRAGSLPEIAGDSAVYFDPYNTTDIAKAINAAAKLKHQAINNDFTWQKTAKQTLHVYQELI